VDHPFVGIFVQQAAAYGHDVGRGQLPEAV
jgi:hypothetical protein